MTRPHELVPGERSDAGSETEEYQTVSKDKPYDTPPTQGKESEKKLRYGGMGGTGSNAGGEPTSKRGQGPQGDTAGGHKPESSS